MVADGIAARPAPDDPLSVRTKTLSAYTMMAETPQLSRASPTGAETAGRTPLALRTTHTHRADTSPLTRHPHGRRRSTRHPEPAHGHRVPADTTGRDAAKRSQATSAARWLSGV
ncbi:hypothetical protein GCM10010344_15710 [Streptomyces bluensis]|nr:hypothetical protein GCM10010344_15710 [Streptomyces bluensis]